jgi:sec-independent protein translocase protein TatA
MRLYAAPMPEGSDWIIIIVLVLVLFGGSQIPKLARSLGQAQKEFKAGLQEGEKDDDAAKAENAKADKDQADKADKSE